MSVSQQKLEGMPREDGIPGPLRPSPPNITNCSTRVVLNNYKASYLLL